MIALGIDPGTRALGWGVVSQAGNRLTHVAHGVIRASGKDPLSTRLVRIAEELEQVLQRHQPSVASVETLFFHKDAQAAAKLGHARGVVLLCIERAQVTLCEHAPARVKRTLTGRGQADKRQVGMMVRALLALDELPPADASDALALAITQLRLSPTTEKLGAARSSRRWLPDHVLAAMERGRARGLVG